MSEEHQAFIKTPRQLITVVILAFVVPVVIIVLLATFVGRGIKPSAGNPVSMSPEAVEARVRPVAGFELRDANAPAALRGGEEVFKGQCAACHQAGVAGAPKVGDNPAWAARIKSGFDALVAAALKGKGAMPPQGGGDFSDVEIARAVAYMANSSGAKFEEPNAPAAQAQGAAAPAAQAPGVAPTAGGGAGAPGSGTPAAAPAQATSPAGASASAGTTAAAAPALAPAPAATAAAPQASPAAAPSAAAGGAGKALYDGACAVCHGTGVAGAPKYGDKAAWAPRMQQGEAALVESTLNGKGAMPPKGGRADASEADLKAAVDYMLAAVK